MATTQRVGRQPQGRNLVRISGNLTTDVQRVPDIVRLAVHTEDATIFVPIGLSAGTVRNGQPLLRGTLVLIVGRLHQNRHGLLVEADYACGLSAARPLTDDEPLVILEDSL
jgi:hypothetical protein